MDYNKEAVNIVNCSGFITELQNTKTWKLSLFFLEKICNMLCFTLIFVQNEKTNENVHKTIFEQMDYVISSLKSEINAVVLFFINFCLGMAPEVGLEPTTERLTVACSTN